MNGLCYRNQSTSDLKIMNISANTWYRVVLDVDIRNNLFSIMIDGVFRKKGCTFRRSGSKIDGIRIESGTSYQGQAWYRNFEIGTYSLLQDDFDNQAINTQPEDWSLVVPTNTTCLIGSIPNQTGHCVVLSDNNTSQQVSMTKYFPEQTGKISVKLGISDSNIGTWSRIIFANGTVNAIEIYNSDLYNFCYRANDGSYVEFLNPQAGTWYRLKLIIDINLKRFDIYVDDSLVKTGCTFRNIASGISQMMIASGESYTGTTKVKDICIREGIQQDSNTTQRVLS